MKMMHISGRNVTWLPLKRTELLPQAQMPIFTPANRAAPLLHQALQNLANYFYKFQLLQNVLTRVLNRTELKTITELLFFRGTKIELNHICHICHHLETKPELNRKKKMQWLSVQRKVQWSFYNWKLRHERTCTPKHVIKNNSYSYSQCPYFHTINV